MSAFDTPQPSPDDPQPMRATGRSDDATQLDQNVDQMIAGAEAIGDQAAAALTAALAETPATSTAPTARAGLPSPPAELGEVDQALASELDSLMQGGLESIDAVLDGVFEEQAVLVQSGEHGQAISPRKGEIESAASRETGEVHEAALAAPSARVAEPIQPEQTTTAAAPSPALSTNAAAAMEVTPGVTNGLHAVNGPVSHSPLAEPMPTDALPAPTTNPALEPPRGAQQPGSTESAEQPAQARRSMLSMPLLSAAALGAVHRVLTVVSQPMNRVPDQWRTGVNIIAVTLALWAPLAWILPGMLHQWRTNAARHAATQATLHAESGHATTPPHDTQGASSDHHAAAAGGH